jgi:hypothetical protein
MRINLRQLYNLVTKLAFHSERVNNFLDHTTGSSDPDILMAAWTIFIKLQPVLNASLAEQLVAVVTLFGFSADFEADLT